MSFWEKVLPGYKGYKEREEGRNTDKLLREFLASRLREVRGRFDDFKVELTRQGAARPAHPAGEGHLDPQPRHRPAALRQLRFHRQVVRGRQDRGDRAGQGARARQAAGRHHRRDRQGRQGPRGPVGPGRDEDRPEGAAGSDPQGGRRIERARADPAYVRRRGARGSRARGRRIMGLAIEVVQSLDNTGSVICSRYPASGRG
ncbi:MAG: hypothetical protein M0C28_41180 [Candidatus Moduliflexus flocculans]|nr:hypothetical protein [Candidatus Moduliflexus flocculans]